MKPTKLTLTLAANALALSLVALAPAAQVSFSTNAPPRGPDDIVNLKGGESEGENVSGGDHDATYIADDRPVQGQTFTTGTNAAGYQLRAVTLREVAYETYALVPYLIYTLRITRPAGGTLEVIVTETAEVAGDAPGNIPSIAGGEYMGGGSGGFITFTLAKPVPLKASTHYGFDVGGGRARHYWQTDGTSLNAYAGGAAYSVSTNESLVARRGDHVFVVALTTADSPSASGSKTSPVNNQPGRETEAPAKAKTPE